MIETVIYISVTRGKDTLTLDGNLGLLGELLTVLNDAARQSAQLNLNHATAPLGDDIKQTKGGMNATV